MAIPWNAYWRLMRFDKPIGTLLLMWPTWWALLLEGVISIIAGLLALFLPGITAMALLFVIAAWAIVPAAIGLVSVQRRDVV